MQIATQILIIQRRSSDRQLSSKVILKARALHSLKKKTNKISSRKTQNPPDVKLLASTKTLLGRDQIEFVSLRFGKYEYQTLLDTCAI